MTLAVTVLLVLLGSAVTLVCELIECYYCHVNCHTISLLIANHFITYYIQPSLFVLFRDKCNPCQHGGTCTDLINGFRYSSFVRPSLSKSVSQSVSQSVRQSISQSVSQSVSQSISQPVSQSASQSVSQPAS